jgi:sulfofructosephosphate aldolase
VRATPRELDDGTWDAEAAIREAARELSGAGQDLYKVQVPLAGTGSPAEQTAASETLAEHITGPWVVLSQGVDRDRFADAVQAACRAGASGFLAGRALWSDVVGSEDPERLLVERALPRLERLRAIVERDARPWAEAR